MGHVLVYRARRGLVSTAWISPRWSKDEDGKKKLFLWLVKWGDIGRRDWDSGEQSIRQSMNDVSDTYLVTTLRHSTHGTKETRRSNEWGLQRCLNLTEIASYLKTWSAQNGVEADTCNGSTLAAWTERYCSTSMSASPWQPGAAAAYARKRRLRRS